MKKCIKCNVTKSLDEFQKRSSNKDGHTGMCKVCKRNYDNNHYKTNTNRKTYIKENRKIAREKSRLYIDEYLSENPCVDCGESDIIVLEFDHVNGEKLFSISNKIGRISIDNLKAEMLKCEVRCANCHRRKTAKQFGYRSSSFNNTAPIA